jgi:hypothetical protein
MTDLLAHGMPRHKNIPAPERDWFQGSATTVLPLPRSEAVGEAAASHLT